MAAIATLPLRETKIVNGLNAVFRPVALLHRQRSLARGIPFRFNSGFRSLAKQRELFERLPRGQAAPPGRSLHEIGFAYDIAGPTNSVQWDIVGSEGEKLGLGWGGRFRTVREPWHFQAPLTRSELQRSQIFRNLAFLSVVGVVVFIARGF